MVTHLQTYKHYKGGTYTLLLLAENSVNRDERIAVYVSHARKHVLAQPWGRFSEPVRWPDGAVRARFVPYTPDEGEL